MITAQDRADIEQAIRHMDAQAATRMTDLDRRCLAYRGRFGEPPCLWLLGDREAAHGFLIKISLAKASIPRRGLNPQISRWRPGSFSATFSGSTRRRCRATTP